MSELMVLAAPDDAWQPEYTTPLLVSHADERDFVSDWFCCLSDAKQNGEWEFDDVVSLMRTLGWQITNFNLECVEVSY